MDFFKKKQDFFVVNVLMGDYIIYRCTQVQKIGSNIKIVGSTIDLETIFQLKDLVEERALILLFNGVKVLYTDKGELFKSSIDLFFTTKYVTSSKELMALIRKEQLNAIIENFIKHDLLVVNAYVGGFTINLFYKKSFFTPELSTEFFELTYDDEDCIGVKKIVNVSGNNNNEFYEMAEHVLALSTVYNYCYASEKIVNNYENSFLIVNSEEYEHKTDLLVYSKQLMIIIFCLMMLSYGMTKILENQNNEIESKLNYVIQEEAFLKSLNKEKQRKEEVLKISGLLHGSKVSYWTNEIIKRLPESVLLTELKVFPIKGDVKDVKRVVIDENVIIIGGSSMEEYSFNQWIKDLNSQEEIQKVNISKYRQKTGKEVTFELKIELNR